MVPYFNWSTGSHYWWKLKKPRTVSWSFHLFTTILVVLWIVKYISILTVILSLGREPRRFICMKRDMIKSYLDLGPFKAAVWGPVQEKVAVIGIFECPTGPMQNESSMSLFQIDPCSLFAERLSQSYMLEITDTDESHVYSLRYEGSKTIFDVKQGVFALTNIPPRQQKWGGWCIDSDDSVSEIKYIYIYNSSQSTFE